MNAALVAIVACVCLVVPSHAAETATYEERAQYFLTSIADRHQPPDFAIVAARLATGRHRPEALADLDSLLARPIGDMFFMYASMGCLLTVRDSLPPGAIDKIRSAWKSSTFYRGDTENHFLMYYAGLYLAAQEWPGLDGSEWFNGKSSQENTTEAREYLMHWTQDAARFGLMEFDSPRYLYYFATPLLLLREFARDTAVRTRAELMLDFLFTDFASEYLAGAYCGAHSRDGESSSIAPRTAEAITYAGLYFGDAQVPSPLQDAAFAALTSYRLPAIIGALATDKPQSLVHRETQRSRTHIRFDADKQPPVYKIDFMTPDFCLGSMQGAIAQPIQQRSWSLIFKSDKLRNAVFALHPTHSARELATFFPEETGLLVGDISKSKNGYASDDKLIGGSAYERIVQDRNVLVALYGIPADDPVDHIDYFIPGELDAVTRDSSGWFFIREGASFAAILPLRPVTWEQRGGAHLLRSHARRNGYVVVASSRNLRPQIKSFEQFRSEVLRAQIDTSAFEKDCTVTVKIGNRAAVRCAFRSEPRGDGMLFSDSEFSYLRARQSSAPHVESERGTGIVTITRPGEELVLDFPANTIRRRAH